MRTRVLVAAAAIVGAATIAGCDRTTSGTVAMTTEPGGTTRTSTSSRPTTTSPRTSTPGTSTPRTSTAPPPGDALDVTCEDYLKLDKGTQTSVIEEILSEGTSALPPDAAEIAKTLADAVCTFLPKSKVSEILIGETPP